MIKLTNLTHTSAGLEKSLRTIQGLCQILFVYTAVPAYGLAKDQLATTRRYFRLFKWVDCWDQVQARNVHNADKSSVEHLLFTTKWSLLGIYFFLEMFTITHAMRLNTSTWGSKVQLEADKFWFYAISTSILLGLYKLYTLRDTSGSLRISNKKQAKSDSTVGDVVRVDIYKNLVIDGCDLFLPGFALRWIDLGPAIVGLAMFTSSLVAGWDIWGVSTKSGQATAAQAKVGATGKATKAKKK